MAACHANAVDIGRHSNCPSDHWQDVIAPMLAAPLTTPSGDVVMLNIGANKGYNLAEFLQRYTASNVTNARWHRLMMKRASPPCGLQCCGVCIVCHRPRIVQRAAAAKVQLHAFELQPSNQELLQQLTALTGAPIEVHGVAVSNYSGSVYTRDAGKPGYESVAASHTRKARSIERKVTTVDAFMAARGLQRVQMVSVDTEGWDGLVLGGMSDSLRQRRIDVVEFEYMRAWKQHMGERGLQHTLAYMDGLGYSCYWQGNRGALAQASGECWREEFHTRISHRWSNLVCSHRKDVLAAFRGMV